MYTKQDKLKTTQVVLSLSCLAKLLKPKDKEKEKNLKHQWKNDTLQRTNDLNGSKFGNH